MIKRTWFVLLLLTFAYFISRLPFYPLMLRGEEGMFAHMFVSQPHGPYYQQIGRLDGAVVYDFVPTQHPALIYETITKPGWLFGQLLQVPTADLWQTVYLRFAFSLYEYGIWLLVACLLLWTRTFEVPDNLQTKRLWGLGLISFLIWPASLINTTNLNIDATVGVLYTGLVCAALAACYKSRNLSVRSYVMILCAAILFGFGKNELSLAFQATVWVCLICWYFWNRWAAAKEPDKTVYIVLLILGIGNLIGCGINFWVGPENYVGGLEIMQQRKTEQSALAVGFLTQWLRITLERLSFILLHLVIWSMTVIYFWKKRAEPQFVGLFLFLLASALFFGFFLTANEVGARYFEPSFVVFLFLYLIVFPQFNWSGKKRKVMVGFLCLFLLHGTAEIGSTVYRQMTDPSIRQQRFAVPAVAKETGCIPVLEQADVFNRSDVDYIAYYGMEDYLLKRGKKQCPR